MSKKFINLVGQKFGQLTVISRLPNKKKNGKIRVMFSCVCDCGKETNVTSESLKSNKTKSCGCRRYRISPKFVELSGLKFGRLSIISRAPTLNGRTKFNAICDCGNKLQVEANNLKNSHTLSCGCLNKERTALVSRGKYKTKEGESGLKSLFRSYKRSAEKRNYLFDLKIEQFAYLTKLNCKYCKIKPKMVSRSGPGKRDEFNQPNRYADTLMRGSYIYNGLDRVDNDIGYTLDNVVPCCKICNHAKSTLSKKEWYEWLERIVVANRHRFSGKHKNILKFEEIPWQMI